MLVFAACSNAERLPTSSFSGPAGLAVAGTDFSRVFVANSGFDAVQVVALDPLLPNIDMAMAPARFFPLFIPAGPNPTDLAATPDGAYVFVLDTLLGAVRMIDATTYSLVPLANALDGFGVVLAPLDSVFDVMVASPSACSAAGVPGGQCVGRIYLGSQSLGQIAVVDAVAAADGSIALQNRGWVPAGGVPGRIAVTAISSGAGSGDRLFVTDLASNNLNQIDITGEQIHVVTRADLGERGGPLAVSANGNYLVVGRPSLQDVLVYPLTTAGLGASPTPLDLQPAFTPTPQCLDNCATPTGVCQGTTLGTLAAHPADLELCSDGNTVGLVKAQPYPGAFLGAVPTRIAPVATVTQPVQVNCALPNAPMAYEEAVAIATLDGSIYFLGLVDITGTFNPRLLTQDGCAAPSLSVAPQQTAPSAYLAPCSPDIAGRKRAVCVADSTGTGVVTLFPGTARLTSLPPGMRLDWEGIVLDGSSLAGSVDTQDEQIFYNFGIAFQGTVQVNDILRLASNTVPAEVSQTCRAALGAAGITDGCLVERRIAAISADGTQLTLDQPLPRSCFADPDALGYVIRAGDAFLVGPVFNGMWQQGAARVAPGQSYGIGSPQGDATGYLAFTTLDLPRHTSKSCTLYNDDGTVTDPTQSPLLRRDAPLDFSLNDPYNPALWGRAIDTTTTVSTPAGQVPGGMVMTPAPFSVLVLSYNGSNGVYVMRPTQPTNPTLVSNIGYVRILN